MNNDSPYVLNTTFKFDYHNEFFVTSVGILGSLILILNSIILVSIVLILLKGQNKPKSYIVLGNICFANLISAITEIVITCKSAEPYQYSYQPSNIERGFLVSSNMASMWSIGFIAVDRLIYIVYAMEYNKMMGVKVMTSITLFTWSVGGFLGLLPSRILDKTILENPRFRISLLLLVQIVTSTFIAIVILGSYLLLYLIYRKKMMEKKVVLSMRYTFKTTVIAMVSCASFIISWEPFLISMIFFYIFCSNRHNCESLEICRQISTTINSPLPITSLLNAFFNPTVYIWWHKPFIMDMKHIYCSKRLREQKRLEFILETQPSVRPYITTYL